MTKCNFSTLERQGEKVEFFHRSVTMASTRKKRMSTWDVERLKKLRAKFDETQVEFAERVGVSLDTIKNWETGGPIPRMACNLLDRLENEVPQPEPV
jgi:DNA-binding transcriptional regulator YiaG